MGYNLRDQDILNNYYILLYQLTILDNTIRNTLIVKNNYRKVHNRSAQLRIGPSKQANNWAANLIN